MTTTTLKELLQQIKLGDAQCFRNVVVFPVYKSANGSPSYLTMVEAFEAQLLTVTEVSQSGSVPELMVTNQADQPVLLLDGEELLGAKQNRVLNTSILLKEKSQTIVPVSCTERGRWGYTSAKFSSSDVVMEHKIRARKSSSVTRALAAGMHYQSDQAEVWHGTEALHAKAHHVSPTHAMHDLFVARQAELNSGLQTFTSSSGQNGLLVVVDGEVAGFDIISRPEAYTRLHPKLVRSYILDALLTENPKQVTPEDAQQKAEAFLAEASAAEESRFDSVGYGHDLRIRGKALAGTALVHLEKVIHAACFRLNPQDESQGMASLRMRRAFGPQQV